MLSSLRFGASRIGRFVADLIYPPSCSACGAALVDAEGLCPACWRAMPFVTRPYCDRYGTPLPVEHGSLLLSPLAIADPPVFGHARGVARYDGVARELVHGLKYGDRPELAPMMARWMVREGQDILGKATLVMPVPMHWTRLFRRKFNQAAALAHAIGQETGLPVDCDSLRRVRRTRPQVGLTRPERAANLQKAFHVSESSRFRVQDAKIVLVDDVMTTAATGNAAARALLKAGAASVDLLVFALVAKGG